MAWQVFWAVWKWIREVEDDAEARLSPERARADRLWFEALSYALATGDLARLPKWLRPALKIMHLNNTFGVYALNLLKSEKLTKAMTGGTLERETAVRTFHGI